MIVRPTSLALALYNAAASIPPAQRAGHIANQVIWRGDNTTAGLIREPDKKYPVRQQPLSQPR